MSTSTAAAYGATLVADGGSVITGWVVAGLGIAAVLIGLAFGYRFVKAKILGRRGGLTG